MFRVYYALGLVQVFVAALTAHCSDRQYGAVFIDMNKVEKWFKRNCNDALNRARTPQENGDVLTYLLTIRK